MNKIVFKSKLALVLSAAILTACTAGGSGNTVDTGSVKGEEVRRVGNVVWAKKQNVDAETIFNQPVPQGMSGLFFVRDDGNQSPQSSTNIAVNDRYLDSLQTGNYTHTLTCAGVNRLSAVVTGRKTNNLLANEQSYQLESGASYFFLVMTDAAGNTQLQPLTQEQALPLISGKKMQNHQLDRVVPRCEAAPNPVIVNLQVLFATNKSDINPSYYPEIERVAVFMNQYPSVNVVIEGHTDNRAGTQYNKNLSQRRADAVREVLIQRYGIAPSRLQAIGYGESQPVADNNTAEGRQQNRRVLAVINGGPQ